MEIHEGEAGFRNACVAPPQPAGCAKPAVEEHRPAFATPPDHDRAVIFETDSETIQAMDPLTHALLGATAAQITFGSRLGRTAALIGATAGLLPDIDILIKSTTDPLLAIEYHRHFTHALAFVPVGGFIAALPWLVKVRYRAERVAVYGAAVTGYVTHGLLDACTNYGTHLLWPFSDTRTSWHWITTIGPLLTLMLLAGVVMTIKKKSRYPALVALIFSLAYIGTAAWQRERALTIQAAEAAARGHVISRAEMFPTVGNHFMWRSAYQSGTTLYTDRIRVMGATNSGWKDGDQIALLDVTRLPPELLQDERVVRDFTRFHYFSAGWVARSSSDPSVIGDARYSLRTDRFEPIWGVRFHPGSERPTEWYDQTAQNRIPLSELWAEITGTAVGYRSLVGK